jgi:Flp pilus assembly protein TadD
MWARTILACLAIASAGRAGASGGRDRVQIPLDELLAGRPLELTGPPPALVERRDVLGMSPEMQSFLDEQVSRGADRLSRLRQLSAALLRGDRFKLQYDEKTRTASVTFQEKRGNCLSFSNMFVAMARYVGLAASFQEVDTPPDWSFRDNAFVLNRHVNVLVDFGGGGSKQEREGSLGRGTQTLMARPSAGGEHIVDFNMDDFRTSYDRRRIPDTRALAHYYNNVAVERMRAGEAAAALGNFRRAVESDPSFSPAWTNLGILYLRRGHPAHAEAAQLQALKADPSDPVAMSNLAGLYERQGDGGRAASYRKRVMAHRNRNPYYRFQLAREAFAAGSYDAAIGFLSEAIRARRNEDQFYFLLGLSHLRKGDAQTARRWLARAEEVAATDALKRRYASKMDILLPPPPDGRRP